MNAVIYVHGKGGSAAESAHYRPLFPDCEVLGLNYTASSPRETGRKISSAVGKLKKEYDGVILIANSVGAFFCLHAGIDRLIKRAYFISPLVDMERMILALMKGAGVTEEELKARGTVPTAFGEDLSWETLSYVRSHPVCWNAQTAVLYGSADALIPFETVERFAKRCGAAVTVMEGGEHWFHTAEQMAFLDRWILENEAKHGGEA